MTALQEAVQKFIVGYLVGAIVATVKHVYASYGVNVRNAQKGLL